MVPGSGAAATPRYFLALLNLVVWVWFVVSFATWRLCVKTMSHAKTRRRKVGQQAAGIIDGR